MTAVNKNSEACVFERLIHDLVKSLEKIPANDTYLIAIVYTLHLITITEVLLKATSGMSY